MLCVVSLCNSYVKIKKSTQFNTDYVYTSSYIHTYVFMKMSVMWKERKV